MSEEKKVFILQIGSSPLDVTNLPALTVGDKLALKAQGLDFLRYARERTIEPEDEVKLILYMLKKLRPDLTEADVHALPALIASSFLQFLMRRATEVDDPFSTRSTLSEQPTAGASAN